MRDHPQTHTRARGNGRGGGKGGRAARVARSSSAAAGDTRFRRSSRLSVGICPSAQWQRRPHSTASTRSSRVRAFHLDDGRAAVRAVHVAPEHDLVDVRVHVSIAGVVRRARFPVLCHRQTSDRVTRAGKQAEQATEKRAQASKQSPQPNNARRQASRASKRASAQTFSVRSSGACFATFRSPSHTR